MLPPLRVLHCPFNVAGNACGLARAEREVGLDSLAVCLQADATNYPVDEGLWAARDGMLAREWKRWRLLRRAVRDFDVVHFNFGSPLLPVRKPWTGPEMKRVSWLGRLLRSLYAGAVELADLKLLKRAGVGIAITYQGDDARQGDWCREHFDITFAREVGPDYYHPAEDANKRRLIARIGQLADRIYSVNPDLLHVLPRGARFVPYASVDPRQWRPSSFEVGTRPVVLHAPTHREVKGTRYVLSAVERLKHVDGIDFEFLLVENLPHAEARGLYRRADILVDQLLAGWYGALAVELMALGKPVVCYIREEDLQFLPPEMRQELPLIDATPDSIYTVLRYWLTEGRQRLCAVGRESRAFVERWHDPVRIAGELKADYEDMACEGIEACVESPPWSAQTVPCRSNRLRT
ncbi:MAG: glycosyltransferase family 1 protein [Planctomycetes bacterium]|nr:glycosyltransferase family 1 protein [Planctomycetota bacterium]